MKLIAGLGNPGSAYAKNRHNAGFQCLDYFARAKGLPFGRRQANAIIAAGEVAGEKVILAKPQTYMNRSGEAVGSLMRWYRLSPADLLLVFDDLDLPLGKIRIRETGGTGGHKGVQSVIAHVGSHDFPRVRVGIDRPAGRGDEVMDYVLSDFTKAEQRVLEEVEATVAAAIEVFLAEGIVVAMNRFNA